MAYTKLYTDVFFVRFSKKQPLFLLDKVPFLRYTKDVLKTIRLLFRS